MLLAYSHALYITRCHFRKTSFRQMGWGNHEPLIVYGFMSEKIADNPWTGETEIVICDEWLDDHDIYYYPMVANKGTCFGFVYGLACGSLETMDTIDKTTVDKAFQIITEKNLNEKYVKPKFVLALGGSSSVNEQWPVYNPDEDDEGEDGDEDGVDKKNNKKN